MWIIPELGQTHRWNTRKLKGFVVAVREAVFQGQGDAGLIGGA